MDNSRPHSNGRDRSAAERLLDGRNDGLFSGIAVMASTMLSVTKSVVVNMRWGVNLVAKFGKMMPYLMVNKIGFERVKEVKVVEEKMAESNVGDLELLKGMCFLDEKGF
ncbi:hypothetical protein C1H46_039476 [Malus baccata]|uniref:Uncharacterized protein n=1 Tax=Malus baccata TaxID=106549 RepID=A0A540KL82_MALBA|nr:hypothetical protein C1H46_039476 [Malus baccata]